MSIKRRLTSAESRSAALEAARGLLIEAGPQAVTLKAVANRIGRTHANLLHHFGTAAALQRELAAFIAETVCASIADELEASRAGLGSPRNVVDLTFDAFDRQGGGALVGWMLLTGNEEAIVPIAQTIHAMVDRVFPMESDHQGEGRMHRISFTLMLMGLGDALIGERLSEILNVERDAARQLATNLVDVALQEVSAEEG